MKRRWHLSVGSGKTTWAWSPITILRAVHRRRRRTRRKTQKTTASRPTKNPEAFSAPGFFSQKNFDQSLPESSLLALNFATFLALILISSPVNGLRPLRAALFETENVPKPTSVSLSPDFNVFVTPSRKDSSATPAVAFVTPASSAILLISSAFVIVVI